jgi:hypothetical protein
MPEAQQLSSLVENKLDFGGETQKNETQSKYSEKRNIKRREGGKQSVKERK